MKIVLLCALLTAPLVSHAENKCATVGAAMEQSLFDAVTNDLNIDHKTLQRSNTIVQVLNISAVDKVFATQLAKIDSDADKQRNGKALLPEEDYFESYYTNAAKNITAKYTYLNTNGKRDVFIASSLANADECSVRFNGYLILSREF
jgi:hypothetical protein